MKKSLNLIFLFILMPSLSFAWGHLLDYKDYPHLYLMRRIADGQPINYCLNTEGKHEDKFSADIEKSYLEWTHGVAREIRKTGRAEEFNDILEILESDIIFNIVSCEGNDDPQYQPNIEFKIAGECSNGASEAHFKLRLTDNLPPLVCIAKDSLGRYSGVFESLLHEVGHSIGLSDQYKKGNAIDNTDKVYSTDVQPKSVMALSPKNLFQDLDKLTCDDAEGIITLFDRELGIARGGETGWASLCDPNRIYIKSIQQNKKETNREKEQRLEKEKMRKDVREIMSRDGIFSEEEIEATIKRLVGE